MPQTKQPVTIFATTAPATTASSTPEQAALLDHVWLFVDFTKGSLTSWAIAPKFSLDSNTWWSVYDANQNQITYSWTANFAGAFFLGSNNTNARMQPLSLCVPLLRFDGTATGTATSSSITVYGVYFSIGGSPD